MGKKHNWVMVSAGVYDAVYKCTVCDALFFEQSEDSNSRPPKIGCITRDFKADKLKDDGSIEEVQVIDYNGSMAICSDNSGCSIITKEQAMKFFSLKSKV